MPQMSRDLTDAQSQFSTSSFLNHRVAKTGVSAYLQFLTHRAAQAASRRLKVYTRRAVRAPGTTQLCKSVFPEEIHPPVGFETDYPVVINSL